MLVRPQVAAQVLGPVMGLGLELVLALDLESEMGLALVLGQALAQAAAFLHPHRTRRDLQAGHQAEPSSRRFLQSRLKHRGGLNALPERISS